MRRLQIFVGLGLLILTGTVQSQQAINFDKPILIEKSDVPEMPRVLVRSNAKGIALIRVSVDATGATEDIALVRSTGLKTLDDFIVQWVREWKFLPKLQDDQTVDGFTILSLRYDLAENRFEAPPVNELTMTLPEPYQRLWAATGPTPETDTGRMAVSSEIVLPVVPIQITKIPPEIQNRSTLLGTALVFSIDSAGKVIHVDRPIALEDDVVWNWLVSQMELSEWPGDPGRSERCLEIPLIIDTSICKVDFGDASECTQRF
ncbi:MAG TPA: TonB family protein [bacterium]|nr:TonB family protein [bacterium]